MGMCFCFCFCGIAWAFVSEGWKGNEGLLHVDSTIPLLDMRADRDVHPFIHDYIAVPLASYTVLSSHNHDAPLSPHKCYSHISAQDISPAGGKVM